ncbi:hypothetical protein ACP70R_018284 [Stipagrostis hirtigluma subsp. patula]
MDVQSCMKATLFALAIIGMVTLLPRMYSCVRIFFAESLPSIVSAVVAPKCLFVFSNIIVVYLVSQSKLSRSSREPLNLDNRAGGRDEGDVQHGRQEEDEVVMGVLLPTIIEEPIKKQENMEVEEEHGIIVVQDGVQMDPVEEEGDVVLCDVHDMRQEKVEEFELVQAEKAKVGIEEQESAAEEELEEAEVPPADELNRRVEDFIARFNMERQLEARMLVCCY